MVRDITLKKEWSYFPKPLTASRIHLSSELSTFRLETKSCLFVEILCSLLFKDSDDAENKTSTVERKPASKDDVFEKAVPQTELLDSTAAKAKAELASKGSLANRQPPSIKKTGSTGSSGDGGVSGYWKSFSCRKLQNNSWS